MALGDLLPQRAVHSRLTTTVLSQTTLPFTAAVSWTTATAARLKLNGLGLSATVTLNITGLIDATPQSEFVVVPPIAPQVAISTSRWTSVTSITSASTASGSVLVEGIEQGGKPITQPQVLNPSFRCRLRERTLRQDQPEQGTILDELWVLYTDQDGVRPADRFLIDGVTFAVDNVYRVHGKTAFHHSEVYVRRLPSP